MNINERIDCVTMSGLSPGNSKKIFNVFKKPYISKKNTVKTPVCREIAN